jgi:SepF-like predicted cell division protein (DUF552 family)
MGIFSDLKKKLTDPDEEHPEEEKEEYVELGPEVAATASSKIQVRPFILEDFEDIKKILDVLREGYTIPLINIKPLKEKDIVELKRAINKLKKTTDAIEGDIAGFAEDWIVVTPSFASIHRTNQTADVRVESKVEDNPEAESLN